MKIDGHIHTPFCPHGSTDSFKSYIEEACRLGFSKITFTEHAPLPEGFEDSTPTRDSGMELHQLESYFSTIERLKRSYQSNIVIQCGLELDYLEGFEEKTCDFLTEYGSIIDDAILSVHFLKQNNSWHCIDYSPELFEGQIAAFGSIKALYQKYYETVSMSISADLGPHKPKRIGHMTLIHKFQKKFPCHFDFSSEIEAILQLAKGGGYALDYNGAGVVKPLCGETYPPRHVAMRAHELGIPLVYGSDAHTASGLGQGLSDLNAALLS